MRNCRLYRQRARRFRSFWTGCKRWSIAATIRPASPSSTATARSTFAAPPASCAIWKKSIRISPIDGTYGIGHTRWATHGRPTEENAHPHRDCKGDIVVVHNGIVENYLALKQQLQAEGHKFVTETDTEVIAHLVEKYLRRQSRRRRAQRRQAADAASSRWPSSRSSDPNKIVAARSGPPVVIGLGDDEYFVASDVPAILSHTRDMFFLADGDMAVLTRDGVRLTRFRRPRPSSARCRTSCGTRSWRKRAATSTSCSRKSLSSRAPFATPLLGRVGQETGRIFLDEMDISPKQFTEFQPGQDRRLRHQLARGAGRQVHDREAGANSGRGRLRQRVPLSRSDRRPNDTLTVVISQSGETADTLAAQREAKQKGSKTLAICNVVGSMITREAAGTLLTHAGPEIGVASTKAFTSQLTALFLLAMYLGQARETAGRERRRDAWCRSCCAFPASWRRCCRTTRIYEELVASCSAPRIFSFSAAASISRSRSKAR